MREFSLLWQESSNYFINPPPLCLLNVLECLGPQELRPPPLPALPATAAALARRYPASLSSSGKKKRGEERKEKKKKRKGKEEKR
jgi:hypothetical protein